MAFGAAELVRVKMCWARGRRGYFAYWGSEPMVAVADRALDGEYVKVRRTLKWRLVLC